jgi:hypothetical protein
VKSVGALQTMLAWAEDRALLRSTPSADPGVKTGARAEHTPALRFLADRITTALGLAPMRQTFAARCRDNQATMPSTIQLRQSDEIPFHGEPRHPSTSTPQGCPEPLALQIGIARVMYHCTRTANDIVRVQPGTSSRFVGFARSSCSRRAHLECDSRRNDVDNELSGLDRVGLRFERLSDRAEPDLT